MNLEKFIIRLHNVGSLESVSIHPIHYLFFFFACFLFLVLTSFGLLFLVREMIKVPELEEETTLHFVCFVKSPGTGRLIELDGSKDFPIDHGPIEGELLHASVFFFARICFGMGFPSDFVFRHRLMNSLSLPSKMR